MFLDNFVIQKDLLISVPFLNQFTSGILNFFRSPRTGLFSVKVQKTFLAINNFSGQ